MKVVKLKQQSNQLLSSSDYSGPYGSVNQTESSSVV